MAEEFQEKTERATPRKKQKAKEKGQILRSKDLASMTATGGMLTLFYFGGEYFFATLSTLTAGILSMRYGTNPMEVSRIAFLEGAKVLLPFFFTSIALVIFTTISQSGWSIKPFTFDIQRANPAGKIKNFFSLNGVIELLKGTLKFAAGGWVVYYIMKKDLMVLPSLSAMELNALVKVSAKMIVHAAGIAFFYYLVVAFIGFIFDKWQYERSLRMTRQEIREEHKEMEGDPMIKSRIRNIHKETARRRIMQEVPTATVIITDPTPFAIALRYEEQKMSAPKIVAKGAGAVAEKIKERAAEYEVPIVEDNTLARALFKFDADTIIPEELYVAVAKILANICKVKGRI